MVACGDHRVAEIQPVAMSLSPLKRLHLRMHVADVFAALMLGQST